MSASHVRALVAVQATPRGRHHLLDLASEDADDRHSWRSLCGRHYADEVTPAIGRGQLCGHCQRAAQQLPAVDGEHVVREAER